MAGPLNRQQSGIVVFLYAFLYGFTFIAALLSAVNWDYRVPELWVVIAFSRA